ncbi:MAG TPA: helix-turn-helix domain-containing protein [Thermoplasmata archaeon]|nr:helix-turn-helix domain-containing protein [Thermoplasmata archaeon]
MSSPITRADRAAEEPWPLSSVWAQRPAEAQACPIRVSLGALGKKWSLVVLRDIAFRPNTSFTQILARTSGLSPRVLSMRLRELRGEGLIEKVADGIDERRSHYRLTDKGRDAVPILTALIAFGMRHHAEEVFRDARPRTLQEVFPGRALELMGPLYEFALQSSSTRTRPALAH